MPYYEPSFGDEYDPDQMPVDYPGFGNPPISRRMTPDGPVIDPMTAGKPIPPPTALDRPHPSRWGRILDAAKKYAPDLIGGALAAGSQPNIAGGGATDIIRAAAAGYAVPQVRAARQQAEARQRRADEIAARRAEADIAQSQAQTQANKAHEALYQKQLNVPGFKEKYDWVITNGGTKEQALIYASGGTLQDKKVKDKTENYTKVRPDVGERLGIEPETDGTYWIANSELQLLKPEKPEKPVQPKETTEEKERSKLRVQQDFREELARKLNRKPGTSDYDQIMATGHLEKPDKTQQEKPATRAQFQAVNNTKVTRMRAAEAKRVKALTDAAKSSFGGVSDADKNAINDEYQNDMEFIQSEYEQDIVNLGGSISPRTPGRHPAATQKRPVGPSSTPAPPTAPRTGGDYLKGRFGGRNLF